MSHASTTQESQVFPLSIILVTDSYDSISRVLDHYREQGDASRIELVIVCLDHSDIRAREFERSGFPNVRTVPSEGTDLGIAEGRGVCAATGDFVVFAQAEAHPRAGFVDAVLDGVKADRWSVIGPSIASANPGSTFAWAALWILYGQWVDVRARGLATEVPGHNSAYRRSALLSLGEDLKKSLEAGSQLQAELRARGHQSLLVSEACVEIIMPVRFGDFVGRVFRQGRQFAGQRRRRWSTARRLAYAAGSPLIPLVRLARIVKLINGRGHSRELFAGLPTLLLGLIASATGESAGYLAGVSPHLSARGR